MVCQKIADQFAIGKTGPANILKNAKVIQKAYKFFMGNCKKLRHGQHHEINEILCYWHQKCLTANAYPDEPILQEETKLIKRLDNDTSATFVALDGWLPNFKTAYRFCETS